MTRSEAESIYMAWIVGANFPLDKLIKARAIVEGLEEAEEEDV